MHATPAETTVGDLNRPLFHGSIAAGFAIADPFAFWASRRMIAPAAAGAMPSFTAITDPGRRPTKEAR